jgi:bile acid:Na+ symporter, BASS family
VCNDVGIATLINLLNLAALMAIMGAMGLQVTFAEVAASARQARLVLAGLAANFVLVPLVTILLLLLFQVDALISAGFLILAVCPGAPVGPPFTAIARGNVPCSIGLMVILAGLSALLAPVLLSELLAQVSPDRDLHIDPVAIVRTLLLAQMLPLAVGLGIHHWAPKLARTMDRPVRLLGNLLLVLTLALIVVEQYPMLSAIRLRGWFGMVLLLASSLAIGWLCGGPDQPTRKALALTAAARNAAVALVIATSSFAGTPAVTAVVAYALVSMVGSLGFALWSGRRVQTGNVQLVNQGLAS